MELVESIGSLEAKGSGWRARLIEADVRGSSAYYSHDVLESGAHLFKKGTHMYADHASLSEREDRPEGSVKNLLGVLAEDAVVEADGLYADLKIFSDKKEWLKERAEHIGLSIRANGIVEESDDGPVLKEFTSVESVDIVTKAGAGGKFVSIAESAKPGLLVESIPESKELKMDAEIREAFDALTAKIEGLAEAVKPLIEAAVTEEPAVEESAPVEAVEAAKVLEALVEAGLPKGARSRVLAQTFETEEALAEAIKAEKSEVEEIAESARVAGEQEFDLVEAKGKEDYQWGSIFGN